MFSQLGQGVIAGGVAAGAVGFIVLVWRRILEPWYEERLYKGVEISGAWEGSIEYPTGGANKVVLDLRRRAYAVTGSIICVEGLDKGMRWTLAGTFRNNILTFTYDSSSKREVDRGAGCYYLKDNGRALSGGCFYHDESDNSMHFFENDIILVRS